MNKKSEIQTIKPAPVYFVGETGESNPLTHPPEFCHFCSHKFDIDLCAQRLITTSDIKSVSVILRCLRCGQLSEYRYTLSRIKKVTSWKTRID